MSLANVDRLLRGERLAESRADLRDRLLILLIAGCGYGAVMGAFGGIDPTRWRQIVYSAVKVPLLLSATFLLSLPSFFVLNALMGLRDDFTRSLTAVAGCQAALTVVLASLAPFTALWYLSVADYHDAILFNAMMFAIASGAGQLVLRRAYRLLILRDSRHRWMLRAWLVVYVFVGIQMGWVLRPFIGSPGMPTGFLREGAFSNAYIYVARLVVEKSR